MVRFAKRGVLCVALLLALGLTAACNGNGQPLVGTGATASTGTPTDAGGPQGTGSGTDGSTPVQSPNATPDPNAPAIPPNGAFAVTLTGSTTPVDDRFDATLHGTSADNQFAIAIKDNAGTVTQGGRTTNVVVNSQIPWSPITLYAILGADSQGIMMGWVYCHGNALTSLWLGGVSASAEDELRRALDSQHRGADECPAGAEDELRRVLDSQHRSADECPCAKRYAPRDHQGTFGHAFSMPPGSGIFRRYHPGFLCPPAQAFSGGIIPDGALRTSACPGGGIIFLIAVAKPTTCACIVSLRTRADGNRRAPP